MSCTCLFKFIHLRWAFHFCNSFNSNAFLKKSCFFCCWLSIGCSCGGGEQEEVQECQFNLEYLSLDYQLLPFKRPGQLELADFCHFDLFYFSAVMYTLIPARLPSVSSSRFGRSSWRGGAGIIKPSRGTSRTLLSVIRGSLQCVLIFLGPMNAQPSLFSIGTRSWAWLECPPPSSSSCFLGLLILSQANTLSGMSCWEPSQSCKWKSHVQTPRGRQWGLNSHPRPE